MANVTIKFNGKEFLLSCDDGQEEHLEELLIQINQKFNDLKNELGNIGENKLLLITSIKVMDEYHETKKKEGTRAVPIYQSTSYACKNADHTAKLFSLAEPGYIYTRLNNPTNDI